MVTEASSSCKTPVPPLLVDEQDLARLWSVSKPTARRIVAAHGLKRVDLGISCRRNLYKSSEVSALIAARGVAE